MDISAEPWANIRGACGACAVYTIAPFYRTPEDIVRDLDGDNREAVARPGPENKRVWASVEKEQADVIEEMFDEADRRDPEYRKARPSRRPNLRLVP